MLGYARPNGAPTRRAERACPPPLVQERAYSFE